MEEKRTHSFDRCDLLLDVSVTLVCSRQTLYFAMRMARHATNIKNVLGLEFNVLLCRIYDTHPLPFHPECAINCHNQMVFAFVDIETISDFIFIQPESDQCTIRLPMSTDISEVLKCKHSFHAHFK